LPQLRINESCGDVVLQEHTQIGAYINVSMPGVAQVDAIETVTFRHVEGNEGEKNGVKRRNGGFFGGKLLKRQGEARSDNLRNVSSVVSGARPRPIP
jgi:hypothetical protein